ncbi:MAG: IS3 family transposase [Bacteroidota bacterium]
MYGLIKQLSADYPVSVLCKVLAISRSSYYDFVGGRSHQLSAHDLLLMDQVEAIFVDHQGRYGSRRICVELHSKGFVVGRAKVSSLMRKLSLKAIQAKSYVPKTTQDDPSRARAPNLLLDREPLVSQLREVIVGDITYWPCRSGWLYLAVWMDLCSRRILGWKLADHMRAQLVVEAFQKVWDHGDLLPGAIIHSDGGSQYKSHDFKALIEQNQCQQSMTRKENHYDNAFIESLFSRLKAEMMGVYPQSNSFKEAQIRLFDYIEGYYNTRRRHSSLGYLSPVNFERMLLKRKEILLSDKPRLL